MVLAESRARLPSDFYAIVNSASERHLGVHLADHNETEREQLRRDSKRDSCQHVVMNKKTRTAEAGKKLVAKVEKEMQEPRLANSIREATESPSPPTERPSAHAA